VVLSVDGALVKRPKCRPMAKHTKWLSNGAWKAAMASASFGCHGVIAPPTKRSRACPASGRDRRLLMSSDKEAFRPMVGSRTKQSGFAGPPMAYVLALNGPVADHDGARSGPGRPARHRGCRLCLLLRDTDASTLGYDVIPKHRSSAGSSALQSEGGPPAQPFLSRRSLRQWRRLRVRYWVDLSLPVKSNLKTA